MQIVAGTPPGGGLDRVARALAKAIAEGRLINVPVEIVNIPGGGARRAWTHYIDNHQGDSHVIGISSPNLTTDYLVGAARFEHSKYTPIATLVTEYIAFGVKSDSSLKTGAGLLGISGPERLSGAFAATPTWKEQSADCVISAWRGVTGPAGITPPQVAYWEGVLRAVTQQPVWREELLHLSWSPMYQDGAALRTYLDDERAIFVAMLAELGLLKV